MLNVITGEHLQDLFGVESWRDHFTALSESLGFSLSIYSKTGKLLFVTPGTIPFCYRFQSASSNFKSQCEASCYSFMMNTLTTGKPDVSKCYAKIMCFAIPIEYLGDKAVILGQGSFASYDDFRESMNIVAATGLDTFSITAPLTFTSYQQTWKVCGLVADSVKRLLQNSQETVHLRKKFETLKNIIGMWGDTAGDRPELLYRDLISRLSTLLEIDCIAVLAHERHQQRYTSLYSISLDREANEIISIDEENSIVKDLAQGKPFVLSAEPVQDPAADFLNGMGALYFFPVSIGKDLEAILRITDRRLTETDRRIITAFCRQTALAIENHRLQQQLYGKFDRFAAISELTNSITPIQNFDTLIQTILDRSAELLKAEQGSLMLLDHDSDTLLLEAKKGIFDGVTQKLKINRGEGIAGRVAEFGEALLVENVENDPRVKQKNRGHYKTPSFISVPLKIGDRIIGVLNLADKTTGEVFDEEDLKLIQSFATHAAVVMERNVFFNKTEELKKLTITDPLTGLLNRRYLHERLRDELARSERYGHCLSLVMLDVDGFKLSNDTFGHPFGDQLLKGMAETLLNTVRSMDIVARYGGDEFMMILPETDEPLAVDIAERVRSKMIKKVELPPGETGAEPMVLTSSIGIVCFPKHGNSVDVLLEKVDKALYRAKNKGKNRIEVFS